LLLGRGIHGGGRHDRLVAGGPRVEHGRHSQSRAALRRGAAEAKGRAAAAWRPKLRYGAPLMCLQFPRSSPEFVKAVAAKKQMTIALDMIPRTTLAQAMDVLSSQANLAGYWAVVAAATRLPKIFPMLMTAAGTITPSRVLIMGVGVAGLQAIGTAKRLGAIVEATDVRPETKEQVESLGGKFLMVQGVEYKQGT